jgi:hypothetical protein
MDHLFAAFHDEMEKIAGISRLRRLRKARRSANRKVNRGFEIMNRAQERYGLGAGTHWYDEATKNLKRVDEAIKKEEAKIQRRVQTYRPSEGPVGSMKAYIRRTGLSPDALLRGKGSGSSVPPSLDLSDKTLDTIQRSGPDKPFSFLPGRGGGQGVPTKPRRTKAENRALQAAQREVKALQPRNLYSSPSVDSRAMNAARSEVANVTKRRRSAVPATSVPKLAY